MERDVGYDVLKQPIKLLLDNWINIHAQDLESELVELQKLVESKFKAAEVHVEVYKGNDYKPNYLLSLGKGKSCVRFPALRRDMADAFSGNFKNEMGLSASDTISLSMNAAAFQFDNRLHLKEIGGNHFSSLVAKELPSNYICFHENTSKLNIFACDWVYIKWVLMLYGWKECKGYYVCPNISDPRAALNFTEKFSSSAEVLRFFRQVFLGEREIGTSRIVVPDILCDDQGNGYNNDSQEITDCILACQREYIKKTLEALNDMRQHRDNKIPFDNDQICFESIEEAMYTILESGLRYIKDHLISDYQQLEGVVEEDCFSLPWVIWYTARDAIKRKMQERNSGRKKIIGKRISNYF